jgi:hypothetical protein
VQQTERAFSGTRPLQRLASMHPSVLPVMRANASLVSINAAFIRTNASFMSTNASFMLASELTSPQSSASFVRTSAAFMRTSESFILTSHLIDSQMLACCAFCQHQPSCSKQVTTKIRRKICELPIPPVSISSRRPAVPAQEQHKSPNPHLNPRLP